MTSSNKPSWSMDALRDVIARYWGFRSFRPLQEQAMQAVLASRDSLVVLPTGGGKSLCYQAPAVLRGDTTVDVWSNQCNNTWTIRRVQDEDEEEEEAAGSLQLQTVEQGHSGQGR